MSWLKRSLPLAFLAATLSACPAALPGQAGGGASPSPAASLEPGATAAAAPASAAPSPSASPLVAPKTPFLTLSTGQSTELSAFAGVRVVTFWATWCSHCQAELPKLDPWAKAEGKPGWAWIAIEASRGSKEEVTKFKADYKIQGELHYDPSGAVADAYGIKGFPTTIVFDASGKEVFRKSGEAGPETFQPFLPK